jgi:hypothetical protein
MPIDNPYNINNTVGFIPEHVPPGDLEVIPDHVR